jgi:hypothetical protein
MLHVHRAPVAGQGRPYLQTLGAHSGNARRDGPGRAVRGPRCTLKMVALFRGIPHALRQDVACKARR